MSRDNHSSEYDPNAHTELATGSEGTVFEKDALEHYSRIRFERLDRVIAAELHKVRSNSEPSPASRARLFGLFVAAGLRQRGLTADDLMQATGLSATDTQALLTGRLAHETIDDRLIGPIAQRIALEPTVLKVMLGHDDALPVPRATTASRQKSVRKRSQNRSRHHP